ncbi:MAG: 50S ribosomal protein L11 methyltransferase [Kiritimatiellae bacterium]|nr:50S ribosomal protein L11 methyltransferase [Kiritimatiellia bacterium]
MTYISCSVQERFVNPLFEVFDGGDFVLSSYRDIEEPLTRMQIFLPDPASECDARAALQSALDLVGVSAAIERGEIPDEDWKLSYRRHFTVENIGRRLVTVPAWEKVPDCGRIPIVLDPGLAFGTGKHETTKACLEYIDELVPGGAAAGGVSFLDMGCGSGILSIAAAKLGCSPVRGFDVDQEAVDASKANAAANGVEVEFFHYGLGSRQKRRIDGADIVVANILGPLLMRFADEIAPCASRDLVVSGILTDLYPEVLVAYESRGFAEVSRKVLGEWTTGLLRRAGGGKPSA